MPAAQIYPDANVARLSRRVPQIALPRLTEEGSRPTLSELGIPPSPLSPSRSLPEEPLEEDDPRQPDGGAPARRLSRKRKLSKIFWPGGSLNRGAMSPPPGGASSERDASAGPASHGHGIGLSLGHSHAQNQPAPDEYGEDLVDWLDIIGEPPLGLEQAKDVQMLTVSACH